MAGNLSEIPDWAKAQRGELYHAFIPELIAARDRCKQASERFNATSCVTRRQMVQMWREITNDTTPLPPQEPDQAADDALFAQEPWVSPPLLTDYGVNIRLGAGAFINSNCTFIDTCPITIGARTLVGPNCSFYSGSHPLDPAVRNGLKGPESGKPITIGEDCWLGGNVIVLPGVTIGRGSTVGAGSVVTKDVPEFHVVVGNPARILRKIETAMDPSSDVAVVDQGASEANQGS